VRTDLKFDVFLFYLLPGYCFFFPFHQDIFKGFVKGATSFLTLLYDVKGSEVTFCHSVFLYFLQFKEKNNFIIYQRNDIRNIWNLSKKLIKTDTLRLFCKTPDMTDKLSISFSDSFPLV
jgi:hypothetical protein